MALVELTWHPSTRSLRGFGFVACALAGWAGYALWPSSASHGLWAVGTIAALCSLCRPRWNRPLYLALSLITYPVGWALAWLLLLGVFYLVVTPIALGYRLFIRSRERRTGSAWRPARRKRDKASYFRQF